MLNSDQVADAMNAVASSG